MRLPHGTTVLDHAPNFTDTKGRAMPKPGWDRDGIQRGGGENPLCNDRYARWVPGGDVQLHIEEYAQQVIDGKLDYTTAVRLVEALTDAVGKPVATKRDLLMALARIREAHHDAG